MPNYVALEIVEDKLIVACAKSSGRRFQINQLFDIELSSEVTDAQIGEQLKTTLNEKGVSRSEVLGIVGRQDAEIREVTVPPAPDNELPDLVRFQAKNVFASLNDNWLFDFVPFERTGDEQRVLAVAIAPQVKDRLENVCSGAGLKLTRILFRPFTLCDLFAGILSGQDNRLLIVPTGHRFDVSVVSGKQLMAARTFAVSGDQERSAMVKQVVAEVKRTIASTRSDLNGDGIKQIVIGADKNSWGELETELNTAVDVPVVYFKPSQCIEPALLSAPEPANQAEQFAATIGAIVNEYSKDKPLVDFLNPRRPVAQKRNLKKFLIPAAAAALLFLVGAGFCWNLLNQLESQITEKQAELNELLAESESLDQSLDEVNVLDKWQSTKVNWLDEIAWISEKLLTPDDVIISRFRGVENSDGFKIELASQMTVEQSKDTSWKSLFEERYEPPDFGVTSPNPNSKDHPVSRPFNLFWKADVESTAEAYGQIAFDRLTEERKKMAESPGDETDAIQADVNEEVEN